MASRKNSSCVCRVIIESNPVSIFDIHHKPKTRRLYIFYDDVEKAREGAKRLEEAFNKARTRAQRVEYLRSVTLAVNKLNVMLKNPVYGREARAKFRKIRDIYLRLKEKFRSKID